jgi:uncharacterized protein (DUF362 family)
LESDTVTDDLDALSALAHTDGGWGYSPGQLAHLEPTCFALLALAPEAERFRDAFDRGLAVLRRSQGSDGFYRLDRGRPEAVWPTSLALLTQLVLDVNREDCARAVDALLALRGRPCEARLDEEAHDIDLKLVGWPWAEGTFSWAEPTAWACLALRRAGCGEHARVAQGTELLLDRVLERGGVNYGNRNVLGRPLEPLPGPTTAMLLALQGHAHDERIQKSVLYLREAALAGDDLEDLCLARIALDIYSKQSGSDSETELAERIRSAAHARSENPYVRPASMRSALTALALNVERGNPFRLPAELPATSPRPAGRASADRRSLSERFRSAVSGLRVRALESLRQPDAQAAVHVASAVDYNGDLAGIVGRQYEHFRGRVPLAGRRVVLKPNLVEYHSDKVINTHPHMVAAAIELCQREGAAEVVVAEGPGHCRNVEYLVAASGLGDVLRHYKVPFVDLNHDEPVRRLNLGRLTGLLHLYLSQTIATADVVISLPKLKTHHWAVATLSLKNLFGTLPGICYGWPKNVLHWHGIDKSIVDIALTRTPDLAIVDGILGMEGDGPLNGTPVPSGIVVMGTDLVAVDATCCRLMQLDPQRVGYLALGAHKKLGLLDEGKILQLGETIADRARPYATVESFKELRIGKTA